MFGGARDADWNPIRSSLLNCHKIGLILICIIKFIIISKIFLSKSLLMVNMLRKKK